jgi:hypothetical protein
LRTWRHVRVMSALPSKAAFGECRRAANPKIKIGLVVCGYSNLTWAPPYSVIGTKQT